MSETYPDWKLPCDIKDSTRYFNDYHPFCAVCGQSAVTDPSDKSTAVTYRCPNILHSGISWSQSPKEEK